VLEAGGQDEVEDDVLVAAARRRGSRFDEGGQPFRRSVAVGSLQGLGELADRGEVFGLGLADEALEAVFGELGRDLEDRAGDGRPTA